MTAKGDTQDTCLRGHPTPNGANRNKRGNCLACSRERLRAAYRRDPTRWKTRAVKDQAQRHAWLASYKLERGCADCGYCDHPQALDFDHVRGVKEFVIGLNKNVARNRLLAELAKCDVVCANCHRVRTATRRATSSPQADAR